MNGREFVGKTSEAVGMFESSELATKLHIPMIKEPKESMASFYDYSMLRSHMESGPFGQTFRRRSMPSAFNPMKVAATNSFTPSFASPFSSFGGPTLNSPFSGSMGIPFQFGAGGSSPDIYCYKRRKEQGVVSGAEALFGLIRVTIEELKAMGKIIDQEDIKNMRKKVENMKVLEDELMKAETYLEEYKYLMELFRDYSSETLTLDTIRGLVEKKKDLLSKQNTEETTLVQILGSLQGLKHGNCEDFVNDDCEYQPATINLTQLPPPKQPDCIPKQKIC